MAIKTLDHDQYFDFEVRGSGRFPFDMLRYDSAWPRTSEDAEEIGLAWENDGYFEARTVKLRTTIMARGQDPITPARWRSFGWRVVGRPE